MESDFNPQEDKWYRDDGDIEISYVESFNEFAVA